MALGHWLKDYIGPHGGGSGVSGGGGGTEPIVLHEIQEVDGRRLDKTFGEIKEAFFNGTPMVLVTEDEIDEGNAYSVTYVGSYFNDPNLIGTVEIRTRSTPVQYAANGATPEERDAAYPSNIEVLHFKSQKERLD